MIAFANLINAGNDLRRCLFCHSLGMFMIAARVTQTSVRQEVYYYHVKRVVHVRYFPFSAGFRLTVPAA
jgi:hypothetical protein